jgi:predicted dehydrogenase
MNRRAFINSSLGSLLYAGASVRGQGPKVKIAFLGGSHSHAKDKVKVVQESPPFELAGLSEPDSQLCDFYAKSGVRLLSQDQILSDKSIQVVAVESAVKDHAPHAKLVLEAGKHLHVEKPPADTQAAFAELVELAQKKQLLMQVGYMWRYNPGVTRILDAAREGWLGKVYLLRGMMNTLIAADRRPEWAQFQGGQMFEQGSHLIDPLVRLMGRPSRITPVLKKHGNFPDKLMDNTVAVFEWGEALGVITSSTLQPGAGPYRSLEILGSNGTAVLRPIEPPTLQIDLAKAAGPYPAGKHQVSLSDYRRYVDDFAELAAAIRSNKPLSVSPKQDLLVQETLLRASEM